MQIIIGNDDDFSFHFGSSMMWPLLPGVVVATHFGHETHVGLA